tara:strand:+ start:86 stop:3448 length:3363 start_codon:yes stop_codon:yes gene_type:complete
MPRYKVNISDGVFEFVDADTEDEAKKKVKAIIATGAISPFYDKLYFDYDTGVRGKFERLVDKGTEREGDLRNLRAQLARAETPREQETVLENFVGSSGFTRNTKGQVALTPVGLEELGLPIQNRTLSDGTSIPLNTVIDENDFGLQTGDLADFAGIAGPITGAITFMLPQARVIKGLTSLFGGRDRIARMFAAGTGSAVGKAGEEALDYQEGFQLQERDELKDLFGGEFLFGSVGQGIGELFGLGYKLLLGRNAPAPDLRLNRQMALGRSASDILKLDAQLGKEATERQIAKAVRDGRVAKFDFKGIASQATLGAKLPGRLQDISEQVLGNTRDKETAAYLRAEIDNLLGEIGGENALLQKSISDATKGSLDEQVQASLQALRLKEQTVTQQLRKLLDDVVDDAIEVGNYADAPGRGALGQILQDNLGRARREVMIDLGTKYRAVDGMFKQLISKEGKSGAELGQAVALDRIIRNTIKKNVDDSLALVKQHKDADYFWGVNNRDELDGGIVSKIEQALLKLKDDVADDSVGINLSHIRNAYSKLNTISRDTLEASPERKVIIEIMRKLDDSRVKQNGEVFIPGQPDSILTQLEIEGVEKFNVQLAHNMRMAGLGDDAASIELNENAVRQVNNAIKQLREANKIAAERMAPFDRLEIKKIISNSQKGAHNADEVYKKVILNGQRGDLEDIFKALRDYDNYMVQAGKPANAERTLKSQLKKRLFADAFRASTDIVDESINFTQFAKEIKRFERDYPGKLDALFTDTATGKNTAKLVRDTIEQVNKIGPRIKPQDIKNLVNDFTTKRKGLSASDQGLAFVQGLKELAKASDERLKLEANRAISDLPLKGIDETVNIIFRPNANANIEILKNTVSPEVFTSIQQASMQKLLSKSIDINGKGRITDLFKAGNLKTALDSYGDETLEAMFGKELSQGLRNFQRQLDTLTKQEAGRGGAAGGLVAAGIGASLALNPIAVLPSVLGLAVARRLFASPSFVSIVSKTDKGSIMTAIDMTEQALRQTLVRQLGMEAEEAGEVAGGIMDGAYDAAGIEELLNPVKDLIKDTISETQDLQQEAQQSLRTTQVPTPSIPLPDVSGTQMPTLSPLSEDRLALDEQLFGRPSRLG